MRIIQPPSATSWRDGLHVYVAIASMIPGIWSLLAVNRSFAGVAGHAQHARRERGVAD